MLAAVPGYTCTLQPRVVIDSDACYAFFSLRSAMPDLKKALSPHPNNLECHCTGYQEHGLQTCIGGLWCADKEVAYKGAELNDVQLAWASTVHKAQGSECPVVVLVMAPHHRALLSRRLLYTGLFTPAPHPLHPTPPPLHPLAPHSCKLHHHQVCVYPEGMFVVASRLCKHTHILTVMTAVHMYHGTLALRLCCAGHSFDPG